MFANKKEEKYFDLSLRWKHRSAVMLGYARYGRSVTCSQIAQEYWDKYCGRRKLR